MLPSSMVRRRSTPRHSFYSRFSTHDSRSSSAYAQQHPQPQSPHVFTSQFSGCPGVGGFPPCSTISVHGACSGLVGASKPTHANGFSLSPFVALTDSSQPIENPTALSPFPATLTGRVSLSPLFATLTKKHRGVGDCEASAKNSK